MDLQLDLTREGLLKYLSNSVIYGNLGLFIGAGYSKAVLSDEDEMGALSWGELIETACKELSIDYSDIKKAGYSYPEIATMVCEKYAEDASITYMEAKEEFKRKICELTNWYPNRSQRDLHSKYLNIMQPNWIITTNYDLVLESLLTGRSISLSPQDFLTSPKNVIPIYHLHGIRHIPGSIIITQEDYVELFRPNEYRQIKLALTIKESTTLILGYGLGDVNVLSAVDWSKNIFSETKGTNLYPHEIIQVIRVAEPKNDPYIDKNNIIIIETDELVNFLGEFERYLESALSSHKMQMQQLTELKIEMSENIVNIDRFINEQQVRLDLLKILSNFEIHLISTFIDFLSRCIDKTWENAMPRNAFHAYDQNLSVLLDIVINIQFESMPPALFEFVADALDRVMPFVGFESGKSHEAERTWQTNCRRIPQIMMGELYRYSIGKQYRRLSNKLAPLVSGN